MRLFEMAVSQTRQSNGNATRWGTHNNAHQCLRHCAMNACVARKAYTGFHSTVYMATSKPYVPQHTSSIACCRSFADAKVWLDNGQTATTPPYVPARLWPHGFTSPFGSVVMLGRLQSHMTRASKSAAWYLTEPTE